MSDSTSKGRSIRGCCVVLIVVVGYSLSIGPMQLLHDRGYIAGGSWQTDRVYSPMVWISDHAPEPMQTAIVWYVRLFDPTYSPYRTHGGVI
ncbi:MAG: hypothetical protein IAG10_26065 [Planctomycetaceae bacterium]|nr:hypothetical protein [Planctomycetaceae bacterium]